MSKWWFTVITLGGVKLHPLCISCSGSNEFPLYISCLFSENIQLGCMKITVLWRIFLKLQNSMQIKKWQFGGSENINQTKGVLFCFNKRKNETIWVFLNQTSSLGVQRNHISHHCHLMDHWSQGRSSQTKTISSSRRVVSTTHNMASSFSHIEI